MIKKILDNVKDAKRTDPIAPIIVLFGLIFVNFGPLNNLPKIKPPRSDATQQKTNENKTILKWKKFENIKNKLKKENIKKTNRIFRKNLFKSFLNIFLINCVNSINENMPIIIRDNNKIELNLIIKIDDNNSANDVINLFFKS